MKSNYVDFGKLFSKLRRVSDVEKRYNLNNQRFAGFIGAGLNFTSQQRLMWYILFVVYAPYAMLPLPLRWCVLAGYGTALTHMVMAGISLLRDSTYVSRIHIVSLLS